MAAGDLGAPEFILCSCSSICCLLLSLSAFTCEASGVRRGMTGIGRMFVVAFSFSANAFSLSSKAFSRASSSAFRRASCCSAANHRKRDEHREGKKFFHIRSKLQLIFRNSDKENGRPTASQMRLNAGSESGIAWGGWGFLREFFRTSTKAKSKGVRPSRADSAIEKAAREKPFRIPPKPIVEPALLRLRRALNLSLVLPPPRSPSCACAVERSSRQARGDRMVVNVLRLLRFIISLTFLPLF